MTDEGPDEGLRRRVRRSVRGARDAVDGGLDATMSRVGETVSGAAREVTAGTAQQVIEELEPYLIEVTVPRIVEGITPYLVEHVVPEILAGLQDHLVGTTVPDVVDGVTDHLVAVTVPEVLAGVTPRLVEELLPALLAELTPYLTDELVPQIVVGLTPMLEQQIAPQLVEALMPQLEAEVAPRLVDGLLPKIRRDVVPTILDDIVDDPRIRDLIREQSQGLFLDALESLRENLADADDIAENVVRRLLGQKPRPVDELALDLVMADAGPAETTRRTWEALTERRRAWADQPTPLAPPGREHAHAGAVTRLLALALDVSLLGWLVGQGLAALLGLLDSVFPNLPSWVAARTHARFDRNRADLSGPLLVADRPDAGVVPHGHPGLHPRWSPPSVPARDGPCLGGHPGPVRLAGHRGAVRVRSEAPLAAGPAAEHRGPLRRPRRPAAPLRAGRGRAARERGSGWRLRPEIRAPRPVGDRPRS